MTNYELFENMIKAKRNNDNVNYNFYAICVAQADNPYNKESKEYAIFYSAHGNYLAYKSGRVGDKKSKTNIINCMNNLLSVNESNPFNPLEKEEAEEARKDKEYKKQLEKHQTQEEQAKQIINEENLEDSKYVLFKMVEAYNVNNDINFKQFAVHLMEITLENLFAEDTPEFHKFEEMKEAYLKHNMRRLHVLAGELCQIINYTEIEPKKIKLEEPKKVLGVPDEKRSWFKFLHPWR